MANCLLPGLIFLVLYGTSVGAFSLKLSRTGDLSCRRSLSIYLSAQPVACGHLSCIFVEVMSATSPLHSVIVTLEDEVLGFPDVHPTRELSFVCGLLRAKKQLAARQHIYLEYRRRSGTNDETEDVLLSNSITVADAVKLIIQAIIYMTKFIGPRS